MKNDKKILIERSIIFTITFFGLLFFMTFDFSFSEVYKITENFNWYWMMFWTHLSNLGAFFWIFIAFSSILLKISKSKYSDKLELFVQSWLIKNLIFTFIIVTGLVFMTIAYVPTIISFTIGSESNKHNDLYNAMVIIGTTIKHLIIPGMFVYLAITEIGFEKSKGSLTNYKKTMILFIFPSLYFVYVLTLAACGVRPPYPILDFGFTTSITIWNSILYLFLDVLIGVLFIFTSLFQFWWNDKKINIKTTDPLLKIA